MKIKVVPFLVILISLIAFGVGSAAGQGFDNRWSLPYQISTPERKASRAYMVADQYGYAHVFWTEELPDPDLRTIIQYTRYDGKNWTPPVDIQIIAPFHPIGSISPVVDQTGDLHVVWTDEAAYSVFYAFAPVHSATSAQNWSTPIQMDIPAKYAELRIDQAGKLHMVYVQTEQEKGVYYINSEDQGVTWSDRLLIDPGISPIQTPYALNFEIDSSGGLHAAWVDITPETIGNDQVRYTHSFDAGFSWARPVVIDESDASDPRLDHASPIMAVSGNSVHIMWAAGTVPYRLHTYSNDAGQTWSSPVWIFGEMQGQAFDGFAIDGIGRVHYFGQVRSPRGIYHAVWEQDHWSTPSLIYLIGDIDFDKEEVSPGNAILVHAHHTIPVIRAGNHIILTFADPPPDPLRRIFMMDRYLEDVAQSPLAPVPTSAALPQVTPTSVPTPTSTPEVRSIALNTPNQSGNNQAPNNNALWFGIIPTLVFVGSTILVKLILKQR